MTLAHLHLILNHVPVVGIPVVLVFLGYGILKNNQVLQRISFLVLFGIAAVTVPVFYTGEPAEEVVEDVANVPHSAIHEHEEAAELAIILTSILGLAALAALVLQNNEAMKKYAPKSIMILAIISLLSVSYTANLGGKIRRPELRSDTNSNTDISPQYESHENDD